MFRHKDGVTPLIYQLVREKMNFEEFKLPSLPEPDMNSTVGELKSGDSMK
jgi:hypothetical protein